MSYTEVFGGQLLHPAITSYLSLSFAADVALEWPIEQQIAGVNVVADIIDADATAGGLNVDMPDARNTGNGNKVTFNNVGANAFTVRDNTGGVIQSVAPGEAWVVVLRDNTTQAGLWRTFQLGASVSVASASALAGAGIKAISNTLNQKIDSDVEGATPFTVVDGDRAKCLIYTAGAGTCNLPNPAAVGNDWFFMLRNGGSGTLNVVPPAGLIDGVASINLAPNESAFIFTDGTNFFTVGLSTGSTVAFDFVSIPVPGSGDFTLSGVNLDRISYRFTGALTGNRRIIVPNTTQQYWIDNQTTGAFTLSISTAAQVGPPTVPQGQSAILSCDATNVINAVSSGSFVPPVTIAQGGTGAITVAAAQANLQVPPTSRQILAGTAMTGGGDLSADRTLNADLANEAEAVARTAAAKIITPERVGNIFQMKEKTANTDRASTVALADDPHLAGFPLQASAQYLVELSLTCDGQGSTTNDLDWGFDFNGQIGNIADLHGGSVYSITSTFGGAACFGQDANIGRVDFSNGGAFEAFQVKIWMTFRTTGAFVGGTNLDFQWAQGTSEVTATRLADTSSMKVTRIA